MTQPLRTLTILFLQIWVGSQHPENVLQLPVTPVPFDQMLFSDIFRLLHTYDAYTHTQVHIYMYIK